MNGLGWTSRYRGLDVAVSFREEAGRGLMVTELGRRTLRCMGGSRQASGLKMVDPNWMVV